MSDKFNTVIECVRTKFVELCRSPKYKISYLPKGMPEPGIYLISEGGRALYIGRTNKLRKRLQYHTRNSHKPLLLFFLPVIRLATLRQVINRWVHVGIFWKSQNSEWRLMMPGNGLGKWTYSL
jgi:hypothetical protein